MNTFDTYNDHYTTDDKTLLHRFFENIDWPLMIAVVLIVLIGLTGVYSATLHYGNPGKFIITQAMAMLIGFGGMLILIGFNYQYFRSLLPFVYGGSLLLLASVLVIGTSVHGTKGWFHLGLFAFQPVELAKIAFILALAGYLDSRWRETKRWSTLLVSLGILFGQLFLIMLQPDFSSTLSYFPVALVLMFVAGIEPLYVVGIMLYGALAAGIPLAATFFKLQPDLIAAHPSLNYFVTVSRGGLHAVLILIGITVSIFVIWWFITKLRFAVPFIYPLALAVIIVFGSISSVAVNKSLKDYQRKRLIVFLSPDIDPLGSAYNIIQSRIAIGSGQIMGKGLFQGTQSQLGFLPEQHTDFIFSVIGEETGYFISQLTIFLYFMLVWRGMIVAREARDRFGSLVAVGISTMFAFYALINIGMVMGMMPATGLPLPLLSYGGSSMVCALWSVGLLFSIHVRRFTH
jgi:rod shape determining protein RodA